MVHIILSLVASIAFSNLWSGQAPEAARIKFKDMSLVVDLVLGSGDTEDASFTRPIAAAVDDEGRIYVAEYDSPRIAVFSKDGEYLESFGRSKNGDFVPAAAFERPNGFWLISRLPEGGVQILKTRFSR